MTQASSSDAMKQQSWVASANEMDSGFPLQNLPFCAFLSGDEAHLGVGIGSCVLDLFQLSSAGHLNQLGEAVTAACRTPTLNALMDCGRAAWSALRVRLTELLHADLAASARVSIESCLFSAKNVAFRLPVAISNYTDFYASIDHATNVGRLFRPDQPLLPNYKYVPIAYHGRASSIIVSGVPVRRPSGQVKPPAEEVPAFRPSRQLDYELEVGAYIGTGNRLGSRVDVNTAEQRIFGLSLLNDWSARDIQAWEYQPLGPFLGKNFATSLSPWVVSMEALAPFRVNQPARPAADPESLPYLAQPASSGAALDMIVEVYLSTEKMRAEEVSPVRLSTGNLRQLYWSLAQMVAHHTSNGCNLVTGDLLGTGTISGPGEGSQGSLLELTKRGQSPILLPGGESRAFLEDGDEVTLRAFCQKDGGPRISLGECRGTILPAEYLP